MSLVKNTLGVGFWTLISRVFGFIRDAVVAFFIGAGAVNDAFIVAFRLPNLFRTIFGEGAFSAAFVPLFSKVLHKEGHVAAENFASQVQSLLFIVLLFFSLVMMFFMPEIMKLTIVGYQQAPEVVALATSLGRITFPYIIFMYYMAFYGGILNSVGRFFAFASAPIILNIVQVIAIILAPKGDGAGYALSYGAIIAGILEMLWVYIFVYRAGFRFKIIMPKASEYTRELLRKMAPGIVGSGIAQINVWIVSTLFASFVPAGISYLYYADRVYQLPLALIGTALGTVLLASLSKLLSKGELTAAIKMQNQAINLSLLLALPSAFGIFALSEGIISLLFGRGEFDNIAVKETAAALMVFSIGLPAFVLSKIFSNSSFAVGDTKTPVKVAFVALLLNIAISWVFLPYLKHVAIALGSSVSAWFSIIVMAIISFKKGQLRIYNTTYINALKILIACGFMFASLLMFAEFKLSKHLLLIIQVIAGAFIYFIVCLLLGLMKLLKAYSTK